MVRKSNAQSVPAKESSFWIGNNKKIVLSGRVFLRDLIFDKRACTLTLIVESESGHYGNSLPFYLRSKIIFEKYRECTVTVYSQSTGIPQKIVSNVEGTIMGIIDKYGANQILEINRESDDLFVLKLAGGCLLSVRANDMFM